MLDPITRLRDARFDGPQALYTEAVRMLSERPALPDDLAGLVDQLRQVGKRCNGFPNWADDAADAIETLAAENARLAASEPKCAVVKLLVWHRVDTFGGDCLDDIGATQQYRVFHRDGVWHANCGRSEGYGSQSEAQEAAQSVEAARILSAITLRPESEVRAEAWVAALEAAANNAAEHSCTGGGTGDFDYYRGCADGYHSARDQIVEAIRAMVADDARAALDRIKDDASAEGMRKAAGLVANEAKYFRGLAVDQHEKGIKYYEHNEYAALKLAEAAADILAAIPQTAIAARETDNKGEMK